MLFWSTRHFAFDIPGKHSLEVILLWTLRGVDLGVRSKLDVWVDYPVTRADNEIAHLMLHPDVGRCVALGSASRFAEGRRRIEAAVEQAKSHPAAELLARMPGHRYSKVKAPGKPGPVKKR